jgi:hypothetical protein
MIIGEQRWSLKRRSLLTGDEVDFLNVDKFLAMSSDPDVDDMVPETSVILDTSSSS